ncbi:hypothetical protein CYFUS_006475 [Cystobacter fuscus]|uniref:Uncharacterized protein n=1 Tax=Cystobacter fuscus TaxID=43 RepID=A0A250JBQ4_9BACT|nr:hypothetical protein [Cystobacter fuscus]ATB41013.1 hypothetical protein CYFUS_006475 [Cystobacter fuscus]
MNRWPLWAVLTPGEPARLERRVRAALMLEGDEEHGKGPSFEVIPGRGRYHAIVGADSSDVGAEFQIAKDLSREVDEPVYAIDRGNDPWAVTSWRKGVLEVLEVDPESLAESLGCLLPGRELPSDSSSKRPLRKVALVEGIRAQEASRALEDAGDPFPPGHYRFEDTPQGLRVSSETGDVGFADITLSERLPDVMAYGVIASPNLDMFFVNVLRGGECIGHFALPPRDDSFVPAVRDIKGENSPERILAALGIPAEWFRNE